MNGVLEGVDMNDSAGTGESTDMDPAAAAAIISEAGGRARDTFQPRRRVTFTIWGVLYIFGYGVIWLLTRGQHPFRGPMPATFAAISLIAVFAALATVEQARSETGLRGLSAIRRRGFELSVLVGYGAMFTLEGALARAGASRPVLDVFGAATPIMVIGLLYLARSVTLPDWPVAALGLWLVIVAALSGYAGAQAVWGIDAIAVGPAFLLVAALQPRRHRS